MLGRWSNAFDIDDELEPPIIVPLSRSLLIIMPEFDGRVRVGGSLNGGDSCLTAKIYGAPLKLS